MWEKQEPASLPLFQLLAPGSRFLCCEGVVESRELESKTSPALSWEQLRFHLWLLDSELRSHPRLCGSGSAPKF